MCVRKTLQCLPVGPPACPSSQLPCILCWPGSPVMKAYSFRRTCYTARGALGEHPAPFEEVDGTCNSPAGEGNGLLSIFQFGNYRFWWRLCDACDYLRERATTAIEVLLRTLAIFRLMSGPEVALGVKACLKWLRSMHSLLYSVGLQGLLRRIWSAPDRLLLRGAHY